MIKEIEFIKQTANYDNTTSLWVSYGVMNRAYIREYKSLKHVKEYERKRENLENLNRLYFYTDQEYKDSNFWNRAKEHNFVFTSFYRLDFENNQKKQEIISYCNTAKDNIMAYHSFDGYDLVVASYCDSFEGLIENMKIIRYHNEENVEETSWSALEVNTLIFTNQEKINNLREEECHDYSLSKISFRFRLKNQSNFKDEIYDVIENLVEDASKKDISFIRNGNYDMELFVKNVKLYRFLSLFKDCQENIFSNQSEERIYQIVDEYEIRIYKDGFLPYAVFENTDKQELLFSTDMVYNNLKEYGIQHNDLYNIIDFMNASWNSKFINNAFIIMYKPIKMFLKKVEGFNHEYAYIKLSYSKFTEAINDVLQIMNYSRVHTARGIAFQGEKMMVPLKLLCYYSVLASYFKTILQESDEHQYSFTISPIKMDDIQTELIFPDHEYTNRLLLVTIPIASLYEIDSTMMQIAHEIGHYVCNNTRRRKERVNFLNNAVIEFIYNRLIYNIDFSECENLKKDIESMLNNKIINEVEKIKKIKGINKETILYREELKLTLKEIYSNVLSQFLRELNQKKKEVGKYLIDIDVENLRNMQLAIENIYESLISELLKLLVNNDIPRNIEWLIMVCDECFSDLCAVIPLESSFEDYQKLFIDEAFKQTENKTSDFVVVRMGLVCLVCDFEIDLEDLKKKNINKNKLDIFEIVKKFVDSFKKAFNFEFGGDEPSGDEIKITPSEDDYFPVLFEFVGFYLHIFQYLKSCKEALIVQCCDKQSIRDKVKKIYGDLKENDTNMNYNIIFEDINKITSQIYEECINDLSLEKSSYGK